MLSLDMVLSSFRDLEPFRIHWKRGFQVQFSPELVVPGEPWHFWELNFDMGKKHNEVFSSVFSNIFWTNLLP